MHKGLRISKSVLVISAGICLLLAQGTPPVVTVAKDIPRLVPGKDGEREKINFYVFSWDEFLALNWPALMGPGGLPQRGVADGTKKPGDPGTRVWETWKADYELFPDQTGHNPPVTPTDWSSWDLPEQVCSSTDGALRVIPMVAKGESVFPGGLNQAMGGPLVDQHNKYVRYEVRVNEAEYNETRDKQWYLRKNLKNYPDPPNLFTASTADSYGAIELKAAWRIMTPQEMQAQPPRYYMTQARLVDVKTHQCSPQPVTVGLVGFHIAHKTGIFAAWVWSTFEQIDNVPDASRPAPALGYSLNNGKPPVTSLKNWGFSPATAYRPVDAASLKPEGPSLAPIETARLNPISDEIAALNKTVHDLPGVKGTVWENYEQVETQWQTAFEPIQISNPKTNQDLYPALVATPLDAVANTTMETFYQGYKGPPDPVAARNALGVLTLGTSCLHCHYQAAQYDFSWVMADASWPSSPASQTKLSKAVRSKGK